MVWPLVAAAVTAGGTLWAADKIGVVELDEVDDIIGNVVETTFTAIGPAVVGAVEGTYAAARETVRDRESDAIAVITIIAVSFCCIWAVKSMLTNPKN